MNLFYQPGIPQGSNYLEQEESRHCVKVLRKKAGDVIRITDGTGNFYDARIEEADARQCTFKILNTNPEPRKNYSIHLAVSPTKNAERLEWFVEKAVEIGVDVITPLDCDHTERSFVKVERLTKIAISAMKQSLKATLPVINEVTNFKALLTTEKSADKFIAYVDSTNPHHLMDLAKPVRSYLVLIGPEGDFSQEELEQATAQGYQKVSLGTSRLRTETAGVVACHILNLINTQPFAG